MLERRECPGKLACPNVSHGGGADCAFGEGGSTMKWLMGVLLLALTVNCVAATRIEESERAKITTIRIAPEVQMPDLPTFIGTFWGVLGNDKSKLKEHMETVHFDLPQILKQQFASQAEKQPFFKGKLADDGQYELSFEVRVYGLIIKNIALSQDCKALLTVVAKLSDPSGKVVWKKMDHADRDRLPTFKADDYLSGDAALKTAFTTAAELVSDGLINDFLGGN